MPQVPYNPIPSVAASQPLEYQRINATPDAFGAQVGQAEQHLGAQVERSADMISNAALDFQRRQDQTDVDAAYSNQFSPAFRNLYQQYYSLQGKMAVDGMAPYIDKMKALQQQAVENLPNEQQKHLFNSISRKRVEAELDGMARYADQQNKVYKLETFHSTLDNYEMQAADKYNDEAAFGRALGSIAYTVDKFAAENDKSSEWARDKIAERQSSASVARLQRMMVNEPEGAKAWYDKPENQSMIEPKARGLLAHQLKAAVMPTDVKRVTQDIMGAGWADNIQRMVSGGAPFPAAGPDAASNGAMFNRLIAAESRGNQVDANGNLLTSAKGAEGVTQVLPTTGTDPGYGVAPMKNKSEAEFRRFGQDYLNAMLKEFGGDQQKAAAAYNWGPDNVKNAIKEAAVKGDNWLDHAPQETKVYVGKVAAPTTANDTRAMLGNWVAEAERRYPNDPVMRDAVITQIKGNISTIVAIQEGVAKQAHSTLTSLMMPDKGTAPPTTLEELTATAQGKQAWALTSPESQRGFIAWMGQNQRAAEGRAAKSSATVNEEVMRRINLPSNDPNKIWNPGQLIPYYTKGLTKTDFEWHTKLIDEQRTPDGQRLSDVRKDFFTAMKPRFDSSTMVFRDEKGGEDNFKFQQYATQKEREYRAAGKDPYLLYKPSSPDYLGNDISQFQRTLAQKVQDRADSVGARTAVGQIAIQLPAEQKRKPDETYADWKKRVIQ